MTFDDEKSGHKNDDVGLDFVYPNVTRVFREVDKNDLIIPINDYQRDQVDSKLAHTIAAHLDWVAFGALTVIDSKKHGKLVADGGTRLSGARSRKDIKKVPCLIYGNLTREQEAEVFLRINQQRKRLSTPELQHAELFAKHDLAITTNAYLQRLHEARVGFEGLNGLRSNIRVYPKPTATIIDILEAVATDKHITARVFKGLVALEHLLNKEERTLQTKDTMRRIQNKFGMLDNAVNVVSERRTYDKATLANAIARTLNIRLRQKS